MNIKMYTIDNGYWLGVIHDGKLFLINYLGRLGDTVRP